MGTFKERFEKYELVFTPFLFLLALIVLVFFSQNIIGPDKTQEYFIIPFIVGLPLGIIGFILLEKFFRPVNQKNISLFLRIPTYFLILVAIIALFLSNYDVFGSIFILMVGMGTMTALIIIASLITYYREYLK
ncbi:MAG: hypothetical protein ACFFD1_03175 [Candidatus Thorarchaeota archaeon]